MSLSIKKKSSFKPKTAPRRPGGPSTQTSAHQSVETQSQTPDLAPPTDILSLHAQTQALEVVGETTITKDTPQPMPQERTPAESHQPLIDADHNQLTLPQTLGHQPPPDDAAIDGDGTLERRRLPSELPQPTPTTPSTVEGSDDVAQQADSLKRKTAPDGALVSITCS